MERGSETWHTVQRLAASGRGRRPGEATERYPAVTVPRPDGMKFGPPPTRHGAHPFTEARLRKRLTCAAVSRALGLNDNAVSEWLQINRMPERHVPAVSALLSVSPEDVRSWFAAA